MLIKFAKEAVNLLNAVIDFGGTNIKLALVKDSKIIISSSIAAESNKGIVPKLSQVKECISLMLQNKNLQFKHLNAVGIATPGIVDSVGNKIMSINSKYADAVDVDFNKWCDEAFSCPVVMDNDANLALLGETSYGCAKGCENAVLLTIGTGLGTAALIEGRLLHGKHFQAGCLGGHFIIDFQGRDCSCGGKGCAETLGGSKELAKFAPLIEGFSESRLAEEKQINMEVLINLMKQKDEFCVNLFDRMMEIYAASIVNLIHAYDPEVIILSGGVMKSKEDILPGLIKKVHSRAWTPWGKVEFKVAENPDSSVLLGLEAMIQRKYKAQ